MCTGMEHCAACKSRGNDPDVLAYEAGQVHQVPKIDDGALLITTDKRRRVKFERLRRLGDPSIIEWPEFLNTDQTRGFKHRVVKAAGGEKTFARLRAAIPALEEIARSQPIKLPTFDRRRKYQTGAVGKLRKNWRRSIVSAFIANYGTLGVAMLTPHLHHSINEPPWCKQLRARPSDEAVQMSMAA